MPTPIDNAIRSKSKFAIVAFAGAVIGAWAWSMTGGETFPREADPTGDPSTWTREELRRWLSARNLFPQSSDTTEQLLERVRLNMRNPPSN